MRHGTDHTQTRLKYPLLTEKWTNIFSRVVSTVSGGTRVQILAIHATVLTIVKEALRMYRIRVEVDRKRVLLSAENRNRSRKSIVSGPKPSASLMPACLGPQATCTRCRRRQRNWFPRLFLHSQSVHSEANDSLRLAHSLPPQLKLCTVLLATTVFTNCIMPKPKVHRVWYDCFRPKPNVRRKCPFVHIRRRNRNRSQNSVDL